MYDVDCYVIYNSPGFICCQFHSFSISVHKVLLSNDEIKQSINNTDPLGQSGIINNNNYNNDIQ